jgi:hypothetical protein
MYNAAFGALESNFYKAFSKLTGECWRLLNHVRKLARIEKIKENLEVDIDEHWIRRAMSKVWAINNNKPP